MPFVEDYGNWKQLEPATNYEPLRDYFYANPDIWQTRPEQGFFSKCGWYKFPYCCDVPWYRELNVAEVIGYKQAELYNLARPLFEDLNQQLGSDFLFWGAELNSVPAGETVARHFDRHFYSDYATRTHIVLQTDRQVTFHFHGNTHHFAAGESFIFNNKLTHSITNTGKLPRLHLVVDFVPRTIFPYIERSIAPFGGHQGTKHILSHLLGNPLHKEFIQNAGPYELYPIKTRMHI